MNNRPRGRDKNVSGAGKDIFRRGSVSGGPVGGGSVPGGSGGGPVRSGGGGGKLGIIPIVVVVLLLLFGNKLGLGNVLGFLGGSGTPTVSPSGSQLTDILGSGASSAVSSGWARTANVGVLDRSVDPSARAKYTAVKGGGSDTVTVMVYMCGTDLESKNGMASSDLAEMKAATLSDKVNLLVYTGGARSWRDGSVSSRTNQIHQIKNGRLQTLVADDGAKAMTYPSTLTGFIKYCRERFPATRYDLILWDHGGGTVSGFGYDEVKTGSGTMRLSGIDKALEDSGVKFDFVGFDACLMATLENALMLNNHADYLIASEETEPGIGWYYTDWLNALSQNTSIATVDLGKTIVDSFISNCASRCRGQKTTLSVIDLAELSATVPQSLKNFSASTTKLLENDGYKTVSDARSGAREFSSNKIDQVDLVHMATNLNTSESKALADTVLKAVKYNRTSSDITNAYGLSVYFPYKKLSNVDSAVAQYEDIGMDSEYGDCIKRFATLEMAGQTATGGGSLSLPSVFSGAGSSAPTGSVTDLLGSLVGGVDGMDFLSGFTGLLGGERTAKYVADNRLDASALRWKQTDEGWVMDLTEDQWKLVHDVELNVFYRDGDGYIDLGLDNTFDFTKSGKLSGVYDGTWIAIDSQPVAYYHTGTVEDGDKYVITGRVPVLVNGDRANLILVFDNENPKGYIAGVRFDYVNGETDTVAKGAEALKAGDKIDFVCDYYLVNPDGSYTYENSYKMGDQLTYTGNHKISNVTIDKSKAVATCLFRDIYDSELWTDAMK